jgi:hypothetical protein
MLAERANAKNVSADYAAGLVDSMLYDAELHSGYEPGFSAPVLIAVVREMRRAGDFVPSQAAVLKACTEHRKKFELHRARTQSLMNLRENAEAVIYAVRETPTDDWVDNGER